MRRRHCARLLLLIALIAAAYGYIPVGVGAAPLRSHWLLGTAADTQCLLAAAGGTPPPDTPCPASHARDILQSSQPSRWRGLEEDDSTSCTDPKEACFYLSKHFLHFLGPRLTESLRTLLIRPCKAQTFSTKSVVVVLSNWRNASVRADLLACHTTHHDRIVWSSTTGVRPTKREPIPWRITQITQFPQISKLTTSQRRWLAIRPGIDVSTSNSVTNESNDLCKAVVAGALSTAKQYLDSTLGGQMGDQASLDRLFGLSVRPQRCVRHFDALDLLRRWVTSEVTFDARPPTSCINWRPSNGGHWLVASVKPYLPTSRKPYTYKKGPGGCPVG